MIQRSHSYPARLEEPTGYVSSPGWEPLDVSGGLEIAWPAPGFSAGPGGDPLSAGGSSGAPAAWLNDIPSESWGGTGAASIADWAAAASSTDPRGSADSPEVAPFGAPAHVAGGPEAGQPGGSRWPTQDGWEAAAAGGTDRSRAVEGRSAVDGLSSASGWAPPPGRASVCLGGHVDLADPAPFHNLVGQQAPPLAALLPLPAPWQGIPTDLDAWADFPAWSLLTSRSARLVTAPAPASIGGDSASLPGLQRPHGCPGLDEGGQGGCG